MIATSILSPDGAGYLLAIWIALAGAPLTPALPVLARLVMRFVMHEAFAALLGALARWTAVALAAALPVASATPPPAAAETRALIVDNLSLARGSALAHHNGRYPYGGGCHAGGYRPSTKRSIAGGVL